MKLSDHVTCFFGMVASGAVEIYNEFSLQHELGIYLRTNVSPGFTVQFERPQTLCGIKSLPYVKKEIDIAVFQPAGAARFAVELKFPRNGQYPEQMFKACEDIAFLEQLVEGGFDGGIFVIAAEDPLFFQGDAADGLYRCFRAGGQLCGPVQKPTGAKNRTIELAGTHFIKWKDAGAKLKFATVTIGDDVEV
jgi:hypothetical protein